MSYTLEQVKQHNKEDDLWMVIDGQVYDVTKFVKNHPGGVKALMSKAGQDATAEFNMFHSAKVLKSHAAEFAIGVVGSGSSSGSAAAEAPTGYQYPLSRAPYGDPAWYTAPSPYHNESHFRVRDAMRQWVDAHLPEELVEQWDDPVKNVVPESLIREAAAARWLPACVPGFQDVLGSEYEMVGGVQVQHWDHFHTMTVLDELSRVVSAGVVWNITAGISIGLPPVLHHATPAVKERVGMPCLRGEKRICLAITEPTAGSDVSGIKTTAVLNSAGTHYVVNGNKKWITNGVFADYFTTAVVTENGISLLLIERGPGVTTTSMKMMGGWGSGTTFVEFDNVEVPVENLLGAEGFGLMLIFLNFNTERWGTIVSALRSARVAVEEAFLFAMRRKTFGKPLVKNAGIVQKLGNCIKKVEATQAWLEALTYQMMTLPADKQRWLGGPLALLKAQSTQTMELCAREALQTLGGIGFQRGGAGGRVERIYREVRGYAIPAGSEEIMIMLGVKDGLKKVERITNKL